MGGAGVGHGHGHGHDRGDVSGMPPLPETAEGLPQWWEDLYGAPRRRWSGRPNARLVQTLEQFAPPVGAALDLGCGEGGDAVWLAARGWTVTGVDVAHAAIRHARELAVEQGASVTFERHDLTRTFPEGSFDLVNAQFLQAPLDFPRAAVLARAAQALTPGGLLLVVDHAAAPPWSDLEPVGFPTPDGVLAGLAEHGVVPGDGWEVLRAEVSGRAAQAPDGTPGELLDSIVCLRRATD